MRVTAGILVACLVLSITAASQERIRSRIESTIADTRQALTAVPEGQRASLVARLDRASQAIAGHRDYLALYELEAAWESVEAWKGARAAADVTTPAAFEAKWKAAGEPRLTTVSNDARVPVFVEALAETAEGRGPATYRASKPYAEDSDITSGLYYLSESSAVGRFAQLARALPWPRAAARPPLRSIAPELDAFEKEVSSAYERMQRSDHTNYIVTSAALTQARTLNERGAHAAALLKYLLARGRFRTIVPNETDAAVTAAEIAAARARLPSGVDHSIAAFFLQRAAAGLDSTDDADRRMAAIVLHEVLPAYDAAIRAPSGSLASAAAAKTTITLVRWPFT